MAQPPHDSSARRKASWILRKFRRTSAAHETAGNAAAAAHQATGVPASMHLLPGSSPGPGPGPSSQLGTAPNQAPGSHAPQGITGPSTTGVSLAPGTSRPTSRSASRAEPRLSSRAKGKQRAVEPPSPNPALGPPSPPPPAFSANRTRSPRRGLLSSPPLPLPRRPASQRAEPPARRSSWDSASSRSNAGASGGLALRAAPTGTIHGYSHTPSNAQQPKPFTNGPGSLRRPQSLLSIGSTTASFAGLGRAPPESSSPHQTSYPPPSRIYWYDAEDPDTPPARPRSMSLSLRRRGSAPTDHEALESNSLFSDDRSPSRASTKPTTLMSFDPAPSIHHAHIAQAPPPRNRGRHSSDWSHARAGTAPGSAIRFAQRFFGGHSNAPGPSAPPPVPSTAPRPVRTISGTSAVPSARSIPSTTADTERDPTTDQERDRGMFRVLVTGQTDDDPPREPNEVISVPGHHRPHPGFNPIPSSLPADNASVLTLASSNAAHSVAGTGTGSASFQSTWGVGVNDARSLSGNPNLRPGSIAGSLGPSIGGTNAPGPSGVGGRPASIASHSHSYSYSTTDPRTMMGSSWSARPPSTGGAKSMTNDRERRRNSSDTQASMRALAPLSRRGSGASTTTRTSTHAFSFRSEGPAPPDTGSVTPSSTSASALGAPGTVQGHEQPLPASPLGHEAMSPSLSLDLGEEARDTTTPDVLVERNMTPTLLH